MPPTPVIDCHTHVYPAEVCRAPRAWAEARGEQHWADLVAPVGGKSIQGWSSPDSMLGAMDAAGVDQACLLGWYWTHEATCLWHNSVMAEWVQTATDRFFAFASIYPNDRVIEQLEDAMNLGFRGVGELHPGVQHFDARSPGWSRLADWCTTHHWPVNLHVTEAVGANYAGAVATPLQRFVDMATTHPELKMILAHWGGGLAFFESNPVIRRTLANVAYDCAASPLVYDHQIFQQMLALVGPDKLLFGSDFPLRIYPRKHRTPEMATFVQSIRAQSGFDEPTLAAFLGGNFQKRLTEPSKDG